MWFIHILFSDISLYFIDIKVIPASTQNAKCTISKIIYSYSNDVVIFAF